MGSVYVCAPYAEAAFVRVIHEALHTRGIGYTSTWADHAHGAEDFARFKRVTTGNTVIFGRRTHEQIGGIQRADVVLVYDPTGAGRETYAEAARAVEWGKHVVWCAPRGLTQWAPGVVRVADLDAALVSIEAALAVDGRVKS